MANLLTTGVGWLSTALKTSAGTAGVYRRESTDETATLTFVRGRTERDQVSETGFVNVVGALDLIVPVSDFVSAFGRVRPANGDEIELEDRTYRVGSPSPGELCYRESQTGHLLRIFVHDVPVEGDDEVPTTLETVTIQRVTRTPNAMNEQEESWADIATVDAVISGQSGREVRRANQTSPTATHMVTMLADETTITLTTDDRLVWAGPGGDVTMGIVFVDLTQVRTGNRVVCLCEAAQ